jgi:hypothetical protein
MVLRAIENQLRAEDPRLAELFSAFCGSVPSAKPEQECRHRRALRRELIPVIGAWTLAALLAAAAAWLTRSPKN